MIFLLLFLLLPAAAETPGGQAFRLSAGEYRWVPFTVNQAPAQVEVRFEVLQGNATVHAELLSMDDFRQFDRGKPHQSLTATGDMKVGAFRKLLLARGQYAVVIANARASSAATVSLGVRVESNPKDVGARELPAQRRLTVIAASFVFFLITVGWSGNRLLRVLRKD